MGSSYNWYNSSKVTHFLYCRFLKDLTVKKILLHPSHFFCPLFHFEMSQNIFMFLKIKVINLLMFLLYPY